MGNIMDGELGIMTYYDRCGKELFRRPNADALLWIKGPTLRFKLCDLIYKGYFKSVFMYP